MRAPNPLLRPYGTAAIMEAAALIRAGGIVAVPTETVYGLAADATNGEAVARIYAAKGRPAFNPLIVHVPDLAAAERIAVFDDRSRTLAETFWPGPLTLVLPLRADAGIASLVTAGLDTIAVRVPRHRAAQALLAAADTPLAAPSANPSGRISPTRAEHVAAGLPHVLVIDDGATEEGLESTIVMDGQVLRPGPIAAHLLDAPRNGQLAAGRSDAATRPSRGRIVAPGQLASHYAPTKRLRLDAIDARPGEYLIGFGEVAGSENLSATGDLLEAAARLFGALHRADASVASAIAVAPVPEVDVGVAINDRLRRAAA